MKNGFEYCDSCGSKLFHCMDKIPTACQVKFKGCCVRECPDKTCPNFSAFLSSHPTDLGVAEKPKHKQHNLRFY